MSHFASMACKFADPHHLIATLLAMGIPAHEILVHASVGSFGGCGTLEELRSTSSSRWDGYATRHKYKPSEPCGIIVTEAGLRACAEAAGDVPGLGDRQAAELGFYDCNCVENPGYLAAADPFEAGEKFVGYLTAAYELGVFQKDPRFQASEIAELPNGDFKIVIRKRPAVRQSGIRNILSRVTR